MEMEMKIEMEIKHLSHQHPLILRDEKKNDEVKCSACYLPILSGPSYGCSQCKDFVLHKSCVDLPKRIKHPFHPLHTLTLLHHSPYDSRTYSCNACRKSCFGFIYHCVSCNFDLDIGCASLVPTISYKDHRHLLTLFEKIYKHYICDSCNTPCRALVLRCVDCNFNVHKSCADKSYDELPKQIQHPFHPFHPLTLSNHPERSLVCGACFYQTNNFSFRCEDCDFTMGVECLLLVPTIKYERHKHLLTLFEKIHKKNYMPYYKLCNFCSDSCYAFVFRCVECDFNLHGDCHPSFPFTIKHKCHIHPLTLTYSVVHEIEDDLDELYCDTCEEKRRDPKYPVYYCAECYFVAEIGCVISEVLPLLIAKQESNARVEEAEIKLASTVEGFLVATAGDEVLMAGGVSATMPSERVGVEVTADLTLAKLNRSLIEEQESNARAKEAVIKPPLSVEGFLGATAGDEVMAGGVSAAIPTEKVGVDGTADPALDKLEGEIATLRTVVELLTAKLKALESEHAQFVASKMHSVRDECLSDASTLEEYTMGA